MKPIHEAKFVVPTNAATLIRSVKYLFVRIKLSVLLLMVMLICSTGLRAWSFSSYDSHIKKHGYHPSGVPVKTISRKGKVRPEADGLFAAAPSISYSGPNAYNPNIPIAPLTPTTTGVVAAGYSNSVVNFAGGFTHPRAIAIDVNGNVYIADLTSSSITMLPAGGGAPVTLGSGLLQPAGVAVDFAGNVYVANYGHTTVVKIAAKGGAQTIIGSGYGNMIGLAADAAGNVYVPDYAAGIIYKIPAGGGPQVAYANGFTNPSGIAVDSLGNVYVSDYATSLITKILPGGVHVNLGSGFHNPYGLTVDASGNVFVADYNHDSVTEIPVGGGPVISLSTSFNTVTGVVVDAVGNVLITDYWNPAILEIKPAGGYYIDRPLPAGLSFDNSTGIISGTPTAPKPTSYYNVSGYNVNGYTTATLSIKVNAFPLSYSGPQNYYINKSITPLVPTGGTVASPGYSSATTTLGSGFNQPRGLAVDGSGNVYVDDYTNSAVKKIPAAGGAPITIGTGFSNPYGVAVDQSGNVYVSDLGKGSLKKIPAGGGAQVDVGFGLSSSAGIAIDTAGNLYVASLGGGSVKKFPAGGGAPVNLGSGFSSSQGVAVDGAGNVFVADYGHNLIKEIPVGGGTPVNIGPSFSSPTGIAVDAIGNLYIASYGDGLVQELPVGTNTPIAIGSGFSQPFDVAVDAAGYVFVTDYGNSTVKVIKPIGGYYISPSLPPGLNFDGTTGTISGTPSAARSATNYAITAYNGTGSTTVILNIAVKTYNVDLSALTPGSGSLLPVFSGATTAYTTTVGNTVTSIAVTPTAVDPNAVVTVNGVTVASGSASPLIPLNVGPNTLTSIVTAPDGTTKKTYTLTVTRAPSSNANLSNLLVNNLAVSPSFTPGGFTYTSSVSNATTSVTLTASTSDATATLTINGSPAVSGVASSALPLNVGPNILTTIVTAQDGTTINTYTVTVTRAPSSNANSLLSLSTGTILNQIVTGPGNVNFTTAIAPAAGSLTVTVVPVDANATATVNGVAVTSHVPSNPIILNSGPTQIIILITAQDGTTTKSYYITVNRTGSTNAAASLALSTGTTLSPSTGPANVNFTSSVGFNTSSLTVTAIPADANATVSVDGILLTGSTSGAIPLNVGPTVINVLVTAQDATTTRSYAITVNRTGSNNANCALGLSTNTTLAQTTGAANVNYTTSVGFNTTSLTVTAIPSDVNAAVKVNGAALVGTSSGLILLNGGPTMIDVVCTAQDGTTKSYSITVNRTGSNNASATIALNPVSPLHTQSATAAETDYIATVATGVASVTITPKTIDPNALVSVNGTPVTSGTASGFISLNIGNNNINVLVTAENGATKLYKLTVTRTPPGGNAAYQPEGVKNPLEGVQYAKDDGLLVHQGLSPNGDGINDVFVIEGIQAYPDNSLQILNRSGKLVFESKGYDNSLKVFDGHSNINGTMQLPGTYFYSLEYKVGAELKRKTGFIILKY